MDTVAPGSRRDAIGTRVEAARLALQGAASAAIIKDDPLAAHLNALALSVDAHYGIYCATEEAQAHVAENVRRHADILATGALDAIRTSLSVLEKELGPQLFRAALPTAQQAFRFWKKRTIAGILLGMVIIVLVAAMFSYAAGLNTGRGQGELAGHTIEDALAAGPNAAMDWALLMANNDPVSSLKNCRKAISTDADGRRYCAMPVWLDPPSPPPQQ